MALIKTKPTKFNIDASYWKVTHTIVDWHNRIAQIMLHGWENKEMRSFNGAPIGEESITINQIQFPFNDAEGIQKQSYRYIKTLSEWMSAEDEL